SVSNNNCEPDGIVLSRSVHLRSETGMKAGRKFHASVAASRQSAARSLTEECGALTRRRHSLIALHAECEVSRPGRVQKQVHLAAFSVILLLAGVFEIRQCI